MMRSARNLTKLTKRRLKRAIQLKSRKLNAIGQPPGTRHFYLYSHSH